MFKCENFISNFKKPNHRYQKRNKNRIVIVKNESYTTSVKQNFTYEIIKMILSYW